ncbi:twin-arginine translocase subunit TatC [Virgibacillus oceani]|uniref:Sec-independent protein translocase protein TatC n=1 Tax=Virgibacillus oceani TaxID=1479511 RepID=A0A917H2V4_9BACI|nr:twin-arginine translocase subunit TatC [Virgibacillus oceani]GGG65698.1 sec-independent protein translocase protein TatC [Virgibacillus oceani]
MSEDQQFDNEKEMNVTGHLSELRNRLIVTAVFFVIFFGLGFAYVKQIYGFLVKDLDFMLNFTSPTDIVSVYFTMAGLVAITGTLPILCIQIWLFIKPGLTSNERKASLAYIPAVFLLFIAGIVFGYLVFTKLIMPFLLQLNDGFANELYTFGNYFKFMFHVTIPFAVLFEIPMIAMFLTTLGIITPDFMRKTRKYAYFILVIIGAIITPPDFVLQIVVAIPLIILYEISIYLSGIVYRKKLKKHKEFMEQDSL